MAALAAALVAVVAVVAVVLVLGRVLMVVVLVVVVAVVVVPVLVPEAVSAVLVLTATGAATSALAVVTTSPLDWALLQPWPRQKYTCHSVTPSSRRNWPGSGPCNCWPASQLCCSSAWRVATGLVQRRQTPSRSDHTTSCTPPSIRRTMRNDAPSKLTPGANGVS